MGLSSVRGLLPPPLRGSFLSARTSASNHTYCKSTCTWLCNLAVAFRQRANYLHNRG